MPAVLARDWDDDGRYVMVLEDLAASGCRFPRPRDDDIGETAGRIVEELAHAPRGTSGTIRGSSLASSHG